MTKATTNPKDGVTKYIVLLEDGKTWLLYAYSPDGAGLDFTVVSNDLAQATSNFNLFKSLRAQLKQLKQCTMLLVEHILRPQACLEALMVQRDHKPCLSQRLA